MNAFDANVLHALNRGAQQSPAFDHFVLWLSFDPLVKGCVFAAVLVSLWCGSPATKLAERRAVLVAAVLAALGAEVLARVLAHALPFRLRPMNNPDFAFKLPDGVAPQDLEGWSSFPSDHAVLFFAVAAGVWMASRRAGAWLLAFTAVVICLPRLYLGLHHPTDLIGGAVLGGACAMAAQQPALRAGLARPFMYWHEHAPYGFYAFGWYFLFELANLFQDMRWMLKLALQALKG